MIKQVYLSFTFMVYVIKDLDYLSFFLKSIFEEIKNSHNIF